MVIGAAQRLPGEPAIDLSRIAVLAQAGTGLSLRQLACAMPIDTESVLPGYCDESWPA